MNARVVWSGVAIGAPTRARAVTRGAQGWALGNLTSVHINVEVGGGAGTIDFPLANVTTN
jgi:hypothetical protein